MSNQIKQEMVKFPDVTGVISKDELRPALTVAWVDAVGRLNCTNAFVAVSIDISYVEGFEHLRSRVLNIDVIKALCKMKIPVVVPVSLDGVNSVSIGGSIYTLPVIDYNYKGDMVCEHYYINKNSKGPSGGTFPNLSSIIVGASRLDHTGFTSNFYSQKDVDYEENKYRGDLNNSKHMVYSSSSMTGLCKIFESNKQDFHLYKVGDLRTNFVNFERDGRIFGVIMEKVPY